MSIVTTAPTVQLGILSNLYINNGSHGSPTWSAVKLIGDLQVPAKWDIAEILIRASRMKFKVKTAIDVAITGKLLASLADVNYVALLAALLSDNALDVMVLNGDKTVDGVHGWRFDAQVIDASEDQGAANVVWNDLGIVPTLTGNLPSSVAVASGAAVFTTI